jgi:putative acetyltransferase
MLTLSRTNSDNPEFHELVVLLDKFLKVTDGDDHAFYSQYNKVDTIKHVVIAHLDNKPAGCGAFKEYSKDTAEIKRMFVLPELRGQGIAKRILAELERWAAELNYSAFILETGIRQPEAINLYHQCGYKDISNYGQYQGVKTSVCMKKMK